MFLFTKKKTQKVIFWVEVTLYLIVFKLLLIACTTVWRILDTLDSDIPLHVSNFWVEVTLSQLPYCV